MFLLFFVDYQLKVFLFTIELKYIFFQSVPVDRNVESMSVIPEDADGDFGESSGNNIDTGQAEQDVLDEIIREIRNGPDNGNVAETIESNQLHRESERNFSILPSRAPTNINRTDDSRIFDSTSTARRANLGDLNETARSSHPVDRHNSGRPVDRHNSGRPVDRHNSGRPVDRHNSGRPVDRHNSGRPINRQNSGRSGRRNERASSRIEYVSNINQLFNDNEDENESDDGTSHSRHLARNDLPRRDVRDRSDLRNVSLD